MDDTPPMHGVNSYWQQLSHEEIAAGKHRDMVGGLWEEMGLLQFDFLKRKGLLPHHTLLDVGCGSLRGGLHFVRYLLPNQYCGLDVNTSLVEAGRLELGSHSLSDRHPNLLVNDRFEFSRFGRRFDFALAVSVFTHLFFNQIERCLLEVKQVLKPTGALYATFFQSPQAGHLTPLVHQPGNVTTFYDSDPFHHAVDELRVLADFAGLSFELIGDWGHPRSQQMACFRHSTAGLRRR